MFRRATLRLNSKRVMGLDYRWLGILYYDPVLAEVDTRKGLKELIEKESQKRIVVLIYTKAQDTLTKDLVLSVVEEADLRTVNDKVLYAFASYSLDESLPCYPVVDIYSEGKRLQRTLGRSPMTLRSTVPYFAFRSPHVSDPSSQEGWPVETTFGIPNTRIGGMIRKLSAATSSTLHSVLAAQRSLLPYSCPPPSA
eukprot:TRINITY_DN848_c0_g2_i1.p1 TRINITY_DN848_c0_g2~~TRINITY_DN848_c0_g2_i1.p1  ORF type:complete len:196 (+),score=22.53 TRINITY_DN848_c0_g2_i1:53-640(+)